MIQTNWVIARLRQLWPNLDITIEQISTTGDRVTDRSLAQIGGDGVFVTEIERALHEGRIDLAVHSLKDLPTVQPVDLRVIVTGPREDVRDVLVADSTYSFTNVGVIPVGAERLRRIGTCSLRRTAQIRALLPDIEIAPLRGNVDTRLRKLEEGQYDGILLASAGLHRLKLNERLASRLSYLPIELLLPAPGQGALGLECRDEPEMLALLAPLKDEIVQATTSAERLFMRHLGAGCYLPVAAYGHVLGDTLTLDGLVISVDGQQRVRVHQSMRWNEEAGVEIAEQLGIQVAEQALEQGAGAIIQELSSSKDQEHQHV